VIEVESSNLRAVDYDPFVAALTIEFRNGGVYEYYRVPYSAYAALMRAESQGKYFHAHIRDRYRHRKVSG
jgi:hypothetical protein